MAQRVCSRSHSVRTWTGWRRLDVRAVVAALLLAGRASILPITVAQAEAPCKPVTGMTASIDKFIDEVQALQTAGQGTLPITDALFGFDNIAPAAQRDLGARMPILVKRQDEQAGVFVNQGPKQISIAGSFADT